MAKPRIFVSSTYYDLKHIRADLERFILEQGYEAVLNEKGSIAYGAKERLQDYCYREISHCDILVSVIGGRYGSSSDFSYSVSNKELLKAIDEGKQVYIFIESSVATEYRTYIANKDVEGINYQAVDDIRIYTFLEEVYSLPRNNTIHEFASAQQITTFLKEQWAGLFQRLLNDDSEKKEVNLIHKLFETSETLDQLVEFLINERRDSNQAIETILTVNHPLYSEIKRYCEIPFRVFFETGEELADLLNSLRFSKVQESSIDYRENYSSWFFPEDMLKVVRISYDLFTVQEDGRRKLKTLTPTQWDVKYLIVEDSEIPF